MDNILRLQSEPDRLFRGQNYPKPFEFNREVATVFDDMVERSIPMYADVTYLASQWAASYVQDNTWVYDIGCSTGTFLAALGFQLSRPGWFAGVDASSAMIAKASEKLQDFPERHQLKLIEADIRDLQLEASSVVLVNYTLQFLPVQARKNLIQRIYEALVPGGLIFISEKVRSPHLEFQETITSMYEDFKFSQGYTRTEIARKKEALENVLIPFTQRDYDDILMAAGFQAPETVAKWNNFASFVAQKSR